MAAIQETPSPRPESNASIQEKQKEAPYRQESAGDLSDDDREFLENFTEDQKKRVMWKVCLRSLKLLVRRLFDCI